MDPNASESEPARPALSRNEFHEEAYLQLNPDVAQGVAAGRIPSGWWHYSNHGRSEGRRWLSRPDPFQGVSREIAPRDEMFTGNTEHYFDVGESALHVIESALFAARRPKSTVQRILDLPCGHGRVLRFLRQAFPSAELTACDLNRDGVDHCARAFGAVPVHSHETVDAIPLHGPFDLIWCGSLLTHLPAAKCAEFLALFQRVLGHRGIVVFTLHGRHVAKELAAGRNPHGIRAEQVSSLLEQYRQSGFGYVDYSDGSAYGFSLTHPACTTGKLIDDPGWRLLGYHETGWDQRQDVIALQKRPASG